MKPKYSVIIPVYNAEKTLRRCVDSLLGENYTDCEIILINDGSKDGSAEICRAYAASHSNVKYIEKENGGVSTARNAGLDAAQGEYVAFVDSDDYVMPGFFSSMDAAQEENPVDLQVFSCCFDDGETVGQGRRTPLEARGRSEMLPYIIDAICRKILNPPWAKMYRREIIEREHIRFPVGASVAEDRMFNIRYSFFIQSYSVSDRIVYVFNTGNTDSLTSRRHSDLSSQFAIADRYIDKALTEAPIPEEEKEQYRKALNFGSCRSIYHDAKLMHEDCLNWFERQRRLGKLCDQINRRHMKYPDTRYCRRITLPVRLRLTVVIDAVAWRLTH